MTASRVTRLSVCMLSILLAAALLSGCVEAKLESEYYEDGSARHAFELTIDRDGIEQLESLGGEGEVDAFDPEEGREEAEAAGFDFTPIETDDKLGSRIAKTFDDGEQVGAAYDQMFSANADPETPAPVGAVTGTFVKDGDEYRLNLTIDSDILFEDSGAPTDGESTEFGDPEDFVDITYIATLPGKVSETNGADLGNGKVEWELPLTGLTEISAVSKEEGSGGAPIAIAGLVALLLVGGLVAGFLFTRRRTPAPFSVGPGAATFNTAPNSQPSGVTLNTAPNISPSGITTNTASGAPPSRSMGTNAPPLARTDAPGEQPTQEQDTTKLP